ncbi:MAG: galactose mutarotase [Bacteroidales bacterium]|nr:galactose mutarotase [Bacteroidales bacterium]MCF8343277.1 galactose mutarotase [Bacteroidales bacterium]MCF8350849.1 galactose mutarotase [Bacteroidales bacterium]MCF8375746.1 galactose mutarotase [Bacteroidales bacterium]MCF8400346.1 galactose mutarotase [Bacteroidales bacterium]
MKKHLFIILLPAVLATACINSSQNRNQMKHKLSVGKADFGQVDEQPVYLYTLRNENGIKINITNYGGIVTHLFVPDKNDSLRDIVLGFDSLQPYLEGHPYFGAIIGRYANRIAQGKFILNDTLYQLAQNNDNNHLHGGIKGFDKVVWETKMIEDSNSVELQLHYLSPHMEESYPGNLDVTVTYSLNNLNELHIQYLATTDIATPVNLTNHSYFNLKGAGNGDILDHKLMIDADHFTPVTSELIPTGEIKDVAGTPFDFRKAKAIGKEIDKVEGGYDHNFVLNKHDLENTVVESWSDESGIRLKVFTDQPGLQFYSGNFLDGSITGKGNKVYKKHYGFCLETQHFPDSPNQPDFPNTILQPGEIFNSKTIYQLGISKQ